MLATIVLIDVKPDCIDDFRAISTYNHECSRKEPGNIRFDLLQDNDDPTKFVLFEVYESPEAAAAHKLTEHYNKIISSHDCSDLIELIISIYYKKQALCLLIICYKDII